MELGGKSPLIIFNDANIDDAVSAAMMANWYSNGEVCSNGTRVFVEESIVKQFTKKLVERTKSLQIGDNLDPATEISALISAEHMQKVLDYISIGQQEGANLVCGGSKVDKTNLPSDIAGGYFVEPTIFTDCNEDMTIVQEEIFGPVLSLLSFQSEEEVIRRANDTKFGLSAGVFTNDLKRAHRVVSKLEAGTTWINNYNLAPVEIPWGGMKQSGIGRENGISAIEHWTQIKSVYVEMDQIECAYK
eukprot:g1212.t1